MDNSSAELPVETIIAACEIVCTFYHDEAIKLWESSDKIREEFYKCESAIGYAAFSMQEKGPSKLLALCEAARASNVTHIRVTAHDFWPIQGAYYTASQKARIA